MRSLIFAPILLAACEPTYVNPDDALTSAEALEHGACDPLMHVFPVGDAHNIGYDHSSCGTGTCDISCPDSNANSDWGGSHHGIDVFAYQGAPLQAVADATVVAVGTPSSTSGLRVRLRDACGWEYYYGHMDQAYVSVGQSVSAGQDIGTMGYTGTQSTHLHFNVSYNGNYSNDINPFDLLNATSATACEQVVVPDPEPDPDPNPWTPGCGQAQATTVLGANQALWSCDGRFQFVMQGDGNLVLYNTSGWPLWNAGTHGNNGSSFVLQEDGNMVIYNAWGGAIWSTGTHGNWGAWLAVQDDGNVVLYSSGGWPLWYTGTHGN